MAPCRRCALVKSSGPPRHVKGYHEWWIAAEERPQCHWWCCPHPSRHWKVEDLESGMSGGEGSKPCLRHQILLEPFVFYGPLPQFGDASVVFAAFWKWKLSPVRFLQDIGFGNHAFTCFVAVIVGTLELDAPTSTLLQDFGVWTSHFWCLVWNSFKIGSMLLRIGWVFVFQNWLKLIYGWFRGRFFFFCFGWCNYYFDVIWVYWDCLNIIRRGYSWWRLGFGSV